MKSNFDTRIAGFTYLNELQKTDNIGASLIEYRHEQTGADFVLVPGGEFMMGCDEYESERPVHKVTLKPFLISKYKVTQAVWYRVMGTKPWKTDKKFPENDLLPAVYVSWDDAQSFCTLTGLKLPVESQWEYACRACTTSRYYWGDEMNGDYVWYKENSGGRNHPVGEKKPNAFDLYDMSGNVWEWCLDSWHSNYDGAPIDESPWTDTDTSVRIRRGGSCKVSAPNCRCAHRRGRQAKSRRSCIGFRVIMPVD